MTDVTLDGSATLLNATLVFLAAAILESLVLAMFFIASGHDREDTLILGAGIVAIGFIGACASVSAMAGRANRFYGAMIGFMAGTTLQAVLAQYLLRR